jgi:hypothetical protein
VAPVRTPPRRFAITDSLTGGSEDSDPRTRQFLVSNLVKVGFSGLSGLTREELRAHEMPYTTGGDQSLPGACPADGTQSASNVAAWAKKFVAATRGPPGPDQFAKSEITDMAMWDEAGWGFGAAWAPFNDSSSLVPLWVAFLKARNVTPADLGAPGGWDTVTRSAQSIDRTATALVDRRRFYWTVRAAQGRLSALRIFPCKSVLYDASVWARRALIRQNRRFPARAGALLVVRLVPGLRERHLRAGGRAVPRRAALRQLRELPRWPRASLSFS